MSTTTLTTMEREIRYALNAFNTTTAKIDPDVILAAIGRAWKRVQAATDSTPGFISTFLTTSANTYSYAVSNETDLASINAFRLTYDGRELFRISLTQLLQYRTGTPTTVLVATPIFIAFEEAPAGTYTAYLWPTPDQAYTIEATKVGIPALGDTFVNDGATAYAQTFVMPGFTYPAVMYASALEVAATIGADKRKALGIDQTMMASLGENRDFFIKAESARVAQMLRQHVPMIRSTV